MNLIGYCPKCTIDNEVIDDKCSSCHTDINVNDIVELVIDNNAEYNSIYFTNNSSYDLGSSKLNSTYYVDYVYLDASERKKFSQASFDLLANEPILKQIMSKQPIAPTYEHYDDISGCDICFDENIQTIKTSCGCTTKYCSACIVTMNNTCCVCKNNLA